MTPVQRGAMDFVKFFLKQGMTRYDSYPIGSMYGIYLPTFTIKFNHSSIAKYTIVPWILWLLAYRQIVHESNSEVYWLLDCSYCNMITSIVLYIYI